MYLVLGYLILLVASFFGIISTLASFPSILLAGIFKKNINLYVAYVFSFLLTYTFIDRAWYLIYDYHLPLILFVLVLFINIFQLSDKNLNKGGLMITQSEIISVILFGLYTFVFVEFNWI